MTKAGKQQHQKRISAPSTWPIHKKGSTFVPKISPGPHSKEYGMPLMVLLRDVLNVGQTRKEIKEIVSTQQILVDGRARSNDRFPVGHMDIVELPASKAYYRIQLHVSNKLIPVKILKKDKGTKVCKVIGKRNIRGGKTQISLHDGRNILLEAGDEKIAQIKGMFSIKIKIPSQEIMEVYPLEEEARAMVTEGRHQGRVGKIIAISQRYGPKASEVTFIDETGGDDAEFRTALDYVFVVGPDLKIER
ncbi:MAG: 30S ribosomal protein S4e [Candidatus Heimdallarchaeota archaeon LC_2]|nr:MAG: 30S ribosomal protein S4e [Candidatus Heimdallarchaeota archaeon LC_2]